MDTISTLSGNNTGLRLFVLIIKVFTCCDMRRSTQRKK